MQTETKSRSYPGYRPLMDSALTSRPRPAPVWIDEDFTALEPSDLPAVDPWSFSDSQSGAAFVEIVSASPIAGNEVIDEQPDVDAHFSWFGPFTDADAEERQTWLDDGAAALIPPPLCARR